MSGRGYSHRMNEGQAWKNADGSFGGWLNVDGHQRRVSITPLNDGSWGLVLGKPRPVAAEPRPAPDLEVEALERLPADERRRALASALIRATYGRKP